MCILFVHVGANDPDSDYSLILASNRDEFYDRPTRNMTCWGEDPQVFGGRDLAEETVNGGTWLAISPTRKKIGALLNLPRVKEINGKTRGKIVADYVKSDQPTSEYVETMKDYAKDCKYFIFVTIDIELNTSPTVQTYSNATDAICHWSEPNVAFSNSLPETPLKKVGAGKTQMIAICGKFKKIEDKSKLIERLVGLLKCKERHLPDPELEKNKPEYYEQLSSVFVSIPDARYGTRTHTIIVVTKIGHIDVVEVTLKPPVNLRDPEWERTEFQFNILNE